MNILSPELLEDESPLNEMAERAIQQFIGFHHAAMGFSIETLAENMGLTVEEWEEIRFDPALTPDTIRALDNYFRREKPKNTRKFKGAHQNG